MDVLQKPLAQIGKLLNQLDFHPCWVATHSHEAEQQHRVPFARG